MSSILSNEARFNQPLSATNDDYNVSHIKRNCSNCGYKFRPVRLDPYCFLCRSHHNQYLNYIAMAKGIGKRPVILPVSLKPYLYEAGNGHVD